MCVASRPHVHAHTPSVRGNEFLGWKRRQVRLRGLGNRIKQHCVRIVTIEFPDRFFKWQGTYGAVSVSPIALPVVVKHIQNQTDHHKRGDIHDSLEAAEEFRDNPSDATN